MPRRRARLFPVGLYATLLVAFCALVAPAIPRRIEARARDVLSLPLRGMAFLQSAPPADAPRIAWPESAAMRRLAAEHSLGQIRFPGREPVFATVVQRHGRRGRRLTQLVLDVAARSVAEGDPVTAGDHLIGRVGRLPHTGSRGTRVRSGPRSAAAVLADRAVVELLNYRPEDGVPWRVPAAVQMPEGDPVRFLLEPANDIDREPLRCRLLEDPYRIARLRRSGQVVRTARSGLGIEGSAGLPADLRIGTLRVWGYAEGGAPIELLVRPDRAPGTLATVVVWRQSAGRAAAPSIDRLRDPAVVAVSRLRLPAPAPVGERWLLAGAFAGRARLGAAVLTADGDAGSRLAGIVRVVGSGYAMATPLGRFETSMAWIIVPDSREGVPAPIEFEARIRRAGSESFVMVTNDERLQRVQSGQLYTGPNGLDCPAWIPVGHCERRPGGARSGGQGLSVRAGGSVDQAVVGVVLHEPPRSRAEAGR